VYDAGEPENYVYFLTDGAVCHLCMLKDGTSAAFAVTGSEGVIGVASFLGGESMPSQVRVVSAGYAYRLKAAVLRTQFQFGGPVRRMLLRYTQAMITQMAQAAVCNRRHSLEQRLCHWILSYLDRVSSNELTITQELIADMLGVRREGITEAVGKLRKAGVIQHNRGHIAVLDRHRLGAQACECYAVVKRECDRLLHPEKIISNTDAQRAWREPYPGGVDTAHVLALPVAPVRPAALRSA
jgi:CRP-like cAMP-binding protein